MNNDNIVEALVGMGFERGACMTAVATGCTSVETAAEFILAGIPDALPQPTAPAPLVLRPAGTTSVPAASTPVAQPASATKPEMNPADRAEQEERYKHAQELRAFQEKEKQCVKRAIEEDKRARAEALALRRGAGVGQGEISLTPLIDPAIAEF